MTRISEYIVAAHLQPQGIVHVKGHACYVEAENKDVLKEGKIGKIRLSGYVHSSRYLLKAFLNPALAEACFSNLQSCVLPKTTTPLEIVVRPLKDIDLSKFTYVVGYLFDEDMVTWQDM
jgi:hypothetical protein